MSRPRIRETSEVIRSVRFDAFDLPFEIRIVPRPRSTCSALSPSTSESRIPCWIITPSEVTQCGMQVRSQQIPPLFFVGQDPLVQGASIRRNLDSLGRIGSGPSMLLARTESLGAPRAYPFLG